MTRAKSFATSCSTTTMYLPNEIWNDIVSFLSTKDILSIAQCNRQLSEVSRRVLWTSKKSEGFYISSDEKFREMSIAVKLLEKKGKLVECMKWIGNTVKVKTSIICSPDPKFWVDMMCVAPYVHKFELNGRFGPIPLYGVWLAFFHQSWIRRMKHCQVLELPPMDYLPVGHAFDDIGKMKSLVRLSCSPFDASFKWSKFLDGLICLKELRVMDAQDDALCWFYRELSKAHSFLNRVEGLSLMYSPKTQNYIVKDFFTSLVSDAEQLERFRMNNNLPDVAGFEDDVLVRFFQKRGPQLKFFSFSGIMVPSKVDQVVDCMNQLQVLEIGGCFPYIEQNFGREKLWIEKIGRNLRCASITFPQTIQFLPKSLLSLQICASVYQDEQQLLINSIESHLPRLQSLSIILPTENLKRTIDPFRRLGLKYLRIGHQSIRQHALQQVKTFRFGNLEVSDVRGSLWNWWDLAETKANGETCVFLRGLED